MAALDCDEPVLFKVVLCCWVVSNDQYCLNTLKKEFPNSSRVKLLEGADLEARGLYRG